MLKLIIVEDEDMIRETLSTSIDWNSIGVELAGTCRDGIEAYHMIIDENPSIVLTDIRMPGMNGLELIEKISETDIITEFILLSGYADFIYAKTAMALHVSHYLVKPCNETEIANAIRLAAQDFLRKRQIKSLLPELNHSFLDVKKDSDTVSKITSYMEEHLHEDTLTLKFIAEHVVFMRPDYVGKLFLQATGEKFSSYLTKKRIQKAKTLLLLNPNSKIADIAETVGCGHNPQYFGQIFKRETGMTPSAFVGANKG